jgi:hypothetical protein
MRTDLLKRVQQLESAKAKTAVQITPGQDAALNAIRRYSGPITWEQYAADHVALARDDLRLAYEAAYECRDWPDFEHVSIQCPPWRVSQLKAKEIHL